MSRRFLTLVIIGVFLSAALIACEDDGTGAVGPSPVRTGGQDTANVRSKMDLSAGAGFFDAPFPIEHMRRADGTVRYAGFPNPEDNAVLDLYLRQADGMTQGFSRAGSIYLPFEGAIDTSTLPSEFPDSLSEGATIFLVNVQSDSARYGERLAFTAVFQDTAVTHIPKNVLKILPFQGTPMEPEAMYAAVVLATQNDATGKPLAPSIALQTMRDGGIPAGKYGELNAEAFGYLWDYCEDFDIDPTQIAAATVFRTGEFESEMRAIREAFAAWPDPAASDLKVVSEYDTFYVVEGKMTMPIYQDGNRPYWTGGGEIHFDDEGKPILQYEEEIRFAVSVPKGKAMPANGYPLMIYAAGQGGDYQQIMDRTQSDEPTPGQGPCLNLTARSIACMGIETANVGPRHPTGSYSGLSFFNFVNLIAFRDNTRQAAGEMSILPKLARRLSIPAALVPEADLGGASEVTYDESEFFLWGHSTGSSIGILTFAVEPAYKAVMMSGAGVSFIYNLTIKQQPFNFPIVLEPLLGIEDLDPYHPLATIFQNSLDPVETAYYAEHWNRNLYDGVEPRDFLIVMGLIDGYYLPIMIDGLIVATGADLAGEVLWPETLTHLPLGVSEAIDLPATGNIDAGSTDVTGVTVQFEPGDDIDGHYSPFVLESARYLYSCYFGSEVADGRATAYELVDDGLAPCPYE